MLTIGDMLEILQDAPIDLSLDEWLATPLMVTFDNGVMAHDLNGSIEAIDVQGVNGGGEDDLTPCVVFHVGKSRVLSDNEMQSALEEQETLSKIVIPHTTFVAN